MAAIFWRRLGAFRTRPELDLLRPALSWTAAVTFASMVGWKRVRQTSGPWESAPAAHYSRTYPKTIFGSSVIIWREEIGPHMIGWFHTACSLIPRSPM